MRDAIDAHDGLVRATQVDEITAHVMAVGDTSAIDDEIELVGHILVNCTPREEAGRESVEACVAQAEVEGTTGGTAEAGR